MSGSQTATARPDIDDPFRMSFDHGAISGNLVAVPAGGAMVGQATDRAMAEVFVAQRVPIKRNLGGILQEATALANAAGPKFFYRIPFKDKAKGTTTFVEGPTIGCAMAAISVYGNCRVEAFPANETQTHWTFAARFVDYEKGLTVMRSFQQRKGQNTGMRDVDRATDIIFQIGQSKAIRNVIVAALGWLTDEMETAAKGSILKRIEGNPDGARAHIVKQIEGLDLAVVRVERVVGRAVAKWLAHDMAKLYAQITAIQDGMASADDLFPTSEALAEELAEAEAAEDVRVARSAAASQPKPAAEPKPRATRQQSKPATAKAEPETTAKAEPEPDHDGDGVIKQEPEPEPTGSEMQGEAEVQQGSKAGAFSASYPPEDPPGAGLDVEPDEEDARFQGLNFQ